MKAGKLRLRCRVGWHGSEKTERWVDESIDPHINPTELGRERGRWIRTFVCRFCGKRWVKEEVTFSSSREGDTFGW